MTQDELKLVLEALERISAVDDDCDILPPSLADAVGEAIDVIKEALAQSIIKSYPYKDNSQQEPVMLLLQSKQNFERNFGPCWQADWIYSDLAELLDTTPPQRTEQEPVAWLSTDSIGERHLCFDKPLDNDPVQPLYTTPPQRKPLTDEEIKHYWHEACQTDLELTSQLVVYFAKAIEAKLKDKNEAL